jgi:ribosomal protein S8
MWTFEEKGLYGEGYISTFQENWEGYISTFQEKGCGMLMDIIKVLYVEGYISTFQEKGCGMLMDI